MMRVLVGLVGLLIVVGGEARPASQSPEKDGPGAPWDTLWPMPSGTITTGTSIILLAEGSRFRFTSSKSAGELDNGPNAGILSAAFQRYKELIFDDTNTFTHESLRNRRHDKRRTRSSTPRLMGLDVTVLNPDQPLQLGVNESYSLSIPSEDGSTAKLKANTTWGALRGLESFAQLVQSNVVNPADGAPLLSINLVPLSFQDAPRFPHRGVLLDTARHYLPVETILRTIDGIAWSKMNTLHWHITDAQSFPIEIPGVPKLIKGAYDSKLTYSLKNVTTIVNYATARGVRVVPEFDVPGHSYSWGIGLPNIVASCPGYAHNINNIPLNPILNETHTVLSKVISNMAGYFPDNVFHIGGDEVVYGCWGEDSSIQAWMNKHGYSNYNKLMQYFVSYADGFVSDSDKVPTHWVEVWEDGINVPPDTIIQVWKSIKDLAGVVKDGYRAILSNSNAWYLNCGFNPSCAYIPWQSVYENEPTANSSFTPAEEERILGGEAVLFGEFADHTNVDPQLWPRGAAVAERLWSPKTVNDVNTAEPRLQYHRCRLVRRGINATPMGPGYCEAGPV